MSTRSATLRHADVRFLLDELEPRTVFDAVPIVDGFYRPGGPQSLGTSPRLPGTVTYADSVPTYTITYAQMKAALAASDPDNDTVFFLYKGVPNLIMGLDGIGITQDNAASGLIDSLGNLISVPTPFGTTPGTEYDTNNDGVPDGPLVLEPGETWTWRGAKYQPFTGRNSAGSPPSFNFAADSAMTIAVTDRVRAWDAVPTGFGLISGNLAPVIDSVALGNRPQPLGSPWIMDVGHNSLVTWTYEQLLAAAPVTDAEQDPIYFLISPAYDFYKTGVLKVNNVSLNALTRDPNTDLLLAPADKDIAIDSPFLIGPGDTISFQPTGLASEQLFTLGVWDRVGASNRSGLLQFAAKTSINSVPTSVASVDLGQLDATKRKTFTGAELIAMMNLSDADGDTIRTYVDHTLQAGTVLINGKALAGGGLFTASDTIEFVTPGFLAGQTGFALRADDAYSGSFAHTQTEFSFSSAAFAYDGPLGVTTVAANGQVSSAQGSVISVVAWRNTANQLIVSYELYTFSSNGTPNFQRINLSTKFGLANLTGDPVVSTNPTSSFIFAPTAEGLVGIQVDAIDAVTPRWFIQNFSAYSADAPVSDLVATTHGLLLGLIVGRNQDGDLVCMVPEGNLSIEPIFENITDRLAAKSQSVPAFVGSVISYQTSWTGLNIAGVDAGGNLWSVWTPTFQQLNTNGSVFLDVNWSTNDLSQITGVGSFSGGLSVHLTSWNGINIAGLNNAGELVVTWWIPAFQGDWRVSNFTQLFGGPTMQAGSISAYTTSWNGLNIIGVDAQGQAHAYWWEPSRAGDPVRDVWSVDPLGPPGFDPTQRLSASSTDFNVPLNRLAVIGVNPSDEVYALYWLPAFGSQWSVLTV